MSTQCRYLIWDGYYDTHGTCNQRRPVHDLITRCQLHLRSLGFYRGAVDGVNGPKTKDAVRHYNYFPNAPIIPEGVAQIDLKVGPELGKTRTLSIRHGQISAISSARLANDDAINDALLARLDAEMPEPPMNERLDDDYEIAMGVCRIDLKSDALSATVEVDPFAIQVLEVPVEFQVGREFAKIRIRITGFEEARSLLFRVYRNFDEIDEPMPLDRVVYQEVLFRDDIRALMDATEHESSLGAFENAALDKIQAKHWRKNAFFFMPEHAPYKVKCWISRDPEAFDDFASAEKLQAWQLPDDFGFHRAFMQLRAAVQNADAHEEPAGNEVVIDQSGDDAALWTGADASGKNLLGEPCGRHSPKVMARYASMYFPDPEQPRGFIKHLLDDPVNTYMSLWEQRQQLGIDFPATYLRETLDELAKHIFRLEQSLCCGRDSLCEQALKDEIREALDAAGSEAVAVQRSKLPYRRTVEFCASFMAVVEWIVHNTRTIPEMYAHQLRDRSALAEPFNVMDAQYTLSHARNQIAESETNEPASYRSLLVRDSEQIDGLPTRCMAFLNSRALNGAQMGNSSFRLQRALEDPNIILAPSYSPLDEGFFCRTRHAPVFILGMIDLHYLNADAHRYTPWQFFNHDLFHTVGNDNQKLPQMWHWMRHHLYEARYSRERVVTTEISPLIFDRRGPRRIDPQNPVGPRLIVPIPEDILQNGFGSPEERRQIITMWHGNVQALLEERPADSERAKAFDIVLFCLLHEPVRGGEEYTREFFPAVPEWDDMRRRFAVPGIINGIESRARAMWFGPASVVTDGVIGHIPEMWALIERRMPHLQATRSVIPLPH